jgi:FAD/FMN-containing dehydrogenase
MTTHLDTRPLSALLDAVECDVLLPGDSGYDQARRVWNADIDRRPAAIVRCRDAEDAATALTWCISNNVPLTVCSGGHNLAGTSVADGAVMISLALLDSIEFDTDASTVTVGAGCRWGDVDRPASELDVAVPAGVVSHTGVAGLTLGGGFGYLSRMHGATIDHLVEAEVVVADGRILTVNQDQHPDLFWALKGAGHNYGIVIKFVFRYVPLPGLATVRQALYAADDRKSILRFFREWSLDAPTNVTTYIRLFRCPPYWSQVPAAHRGKPVISVATVFYGDADTEPDVTAPMFAQADPVYESLRTIPHVTLQHSTDDEFRYGLSHYWKHQYLPDLPDEVLDIALEWADRYPGRPLNASASIAHQVMCPFEFIAGTREPRDSSNDALGEAATPFSANIGADWEFAEEKDELVRWARDFNAALQPYQQGTYINFTSVQGDEELARAVYGDKYDRLVAVKRAYDPGNAFKRGLVDLAEHTP